MDVKGTLKAITLELRRELEGKYDAQGSWQPGDLERRLAAIGVRRDRAPVPVDELLHLTPEDREARRVVDAFIQSHAEAGQSRETAIAEFMRDAAYTWANRLLALRCMEARGLIDEVILQKDPYGGRSLQHTRLARKEPARCAGEDEGLFAVLFDEFSRRAHELPLLFDPRAPEVALRPSVAALKHCVALLSGTLPAKGQEAATDEVFTAPDALGWTYQYWNAEEKARVDDWLKTRRGFKCEGYDIVYKTGLYTERYVVKFLVQNSLGAIWMGMYPDSRLCESWEYYVRDADRAAVSKKPVSEITFLDPACGSGHFLIEAFELLYAMYVEEAAITDLGQICAAILERNLYGIDIDERAVQIAALALVMKAKEKAPDIVPRQVNLVATNIRLPAGKEHLDAFLRKHPEDAPLKPALLAIFEGLAHADEIGSLLQIEEPVEKELRHLKEQYEAAKSMPEQRALWAELDKPRQGQLPLGVEDYPAWKQRTLDRIRSHFEAETSDRDLVAAFFGEAAEKGLSLVDFLARRYDVVAANPPYMGSKNMGAVLKRHVERHFPAGKRDLFAAFILRCTELATQNGRVAIVTQHSWMFLRSFADLRSMDVEETPKAPQTFSGVLRETAIEALAHLGEHAFADSSAAGAFVAMLVFSRTEPCPEHRLTAFRLVGPKTPEEKDALLRQALRNQAPAVVSRPLQARFLTIPQAPLCYWLRERFFELLAGRTLGEFAACQNGITTYNNNRFLRKHWEVLLPSKNGFLPFAKGGGFARWAGLEHDLLLWGKNGERLKAYIDQTYPYLKGNYGWALKENTFFKHGWTWTLMARGALGVRKLDGKTLFDSACPAAFGDAPLSNIGAILNCRVASYLMRSISSDIKFRESYIARAPLPDDIPDSLAALESAAISLKRHVVALGPTERSFGGIPVAGASLTDAWRRLSNESESVAAVLHTLEGLSEREVFAAYGIAGDDLQAVLDETGTPAGWFPLPAGYDAIPVLPQRLEVPAELLATLSREPRRTLSPGEIAVLKRRLRRLYEAGPGAKAAVESEEASAEDEETEEGAVSGARIPIPAETFLEELSQKLELHPISTYCFLRELRDQDGVICKPDLIHFVEDYASVIVLRLIGHCWPREVEAGEAPPAWADRDGIMPLSDGTGEPTLLARVRNRLAADFGAEGVAALEREFEEIVGKPLGTWLTEDLFKRHISQFRKRPIAWQLASAPREGGRRRGRGAGQRAPVFSCLVYYHRIDGDLLPKLRSQYFGPLRTRFQTELAGLEKLKERTADQDARRLQLEAQVEELKVFDGRLEGLITEGFVSSALDKGAAEEPLDKWASRDGRALAPASRDALLAQERRYDPDLNDGVRVNIAPLQRAGLLAADVLAPKDLEKAIADRAQWRADERRWCREGKLPRPGWWPGGASEAKLSATERKDKEAPAMENRP